MIEFKAWAKTPRLKKDMVVTEKIDGTNACVIIEDHTVFTRPDYWSTGTRVGTPVDGVKDGGPRGVAVQTRIPAMDETRIFMVGAQSRTRLVTPEKDNFGFAAWVHENAEELVLTLGPGHHFGEWWGKGIQRGYGQSGRHFSLFNVNRYAGPLEGAMHKGLKIAEGELLLVPELYRGPFNMTTIDEILADLHNNGSKAAPGGFTPAEGVIVYHVGAGTVFKAFCDPADEAAPKGAPQSAPKGSRE